MQNGPSYRVYTPTDLKCLAPVAYRSAPPPPSRTWFAVGFVLFVGLFVGGGGFAALRVFDADLTTARSSLVAPAAPPLAAIASPVAADPVAVSPAAVSAPPPAAEPELTPSSSARRKPRGHRRSAAPGASASSPSALDLPRGPVVARPAAPPSALPPNPF